MLGLAISITAKAFQDKRDKGGEPYIMHCLRVMNGVSHLGESVMCAAVMHDLIEDTEWTIADLHESGFSTKTTGIISFLTHKDGISYMDYIKFLAHNKDAVEIKRADLRDNSDITRLKGLTRKDHNRMEKYHTAYTYLSEL